MQLKQKNMKLGAAFLFVVFGLLFFALIARFFYIEATGQAGGEVLAAKIEKKYEKQRVLEAKRGSILDTNGEVIAEDTASYTLFAVLDKKMKPNYVADPKRTAKELAKVIDMDEAHIYTLLIKDKKQVEFGNAGKDISYEVKSNIEKLKLPGIAFSRENKRFYPNGVFASHLIGYVEKDEKTNEMIGKMGIEKFLNKELKETDGKLTFDGDKWGFSLPDSKENVIAPVNGTNVTLTIDKKIQTFLEDSMSKVQEKYDPEQIIAIVSNPKTGEILAMGQRPTFHPKTKEGLTDTWRNLAIEEPYEPGSTMKIFTLAAAVEEGAFNPNDTFVSGSYKIKGTKPINDHSGMPSGEKMTFLEGIQRSSNVGVVTFAMDHLGEDKLRDYLTKFGLDRLTGIDLPFEKTGTIQYKYKRDKAMTSVGQASSITAIQQIQAASAIANNGKMMKPYVIKKLTDPSTNKTIQKTTPTMAGQPISAETAKKVREYLGTVLTAEHGTGKKYKIDGYEVAGKTGTAQFSTSDGISRGGGNYIFSFLGMAPLDDPELVVYVAVKKPKLKAGEVGSDPVAEIFNPVMKSSLRYLNIEPAHIPNQTSEKISDYTNQPVKSAVENLGKSGYEVVTIGKGTTVINQAPKAGTVLLEGEKIIIRTEGDMLAPDLTGWSLRDVMKLASIAKLKLNAAGNGYVESQNFKVGTIMKEADYFLVNLKKPGDIVQEEMEPKDKEDEVVD
ncbi:penicillin-binding protein [Peribacillus loiseleuriae]|uniref:serine-type D-Ala-D-Ala carboxypeptidase n=1 Tax=Peribacillus loiseleuriae TaxID=1679170 RepID=A0A0K9GRV6_9BACI|nr:penicillin-binding protein [Peribacillus loiseleuriae]KMY49351.1 penicillin-binding protein [Peribacillus loiseleuriae]